MPVLVTPLHADGSIDVEGHERLLDHVLAHPLAGLWILGSASEDFLLTHEQSVEATRVISEKCDGQTHIIAGIGDPVPSRMWRFFDETAGMNIDAYHLLPNDVKMNPTLFRRYVTDLADRAPKPLWLYNNPLRGATLDMEVVRELSEHPNIVGIKAAGYNLKEIIPLTMMNREGFQVIGSGGAHLLLFLVQGCTCHTASPASMWPGTYNRIFELYNAGKIAEARDLAFKLSGVIKALPHPRNTEFSAEEKIVLEIMGICKRHVAAPFRECTDAEKEQAAKVLAESPVELF